MPMIQHILNSMKIKTTNKNLKKTNLTLHVLMPLRFLKSMNLYYFTSMLHPLTVGLLQVSSF